MNKHLALLCVITLCSMSSLAHSQQREPAWRVINSISPTVVPDYNNAPNPFPIRAMPKTAVEEIDYVALEQAQTRAQIIAELRQVILSNNAYSPDFSPYKATGYLVGRKGAQVLMGGRWIREGDTVSVNVTGTDRIFKLHEKLAELDPKVAKEIKRDLERILPKGNTLRTTIIKITPESVTLQDPTGRRYTRPIE